MDMAETAQFTIGSSASCTDGACGEVSRVVVDPVAHAITHLVVEPVHRHGFGRLVPLDLVGGTPGEIRLRCTMAEFGRLGVAEETRFVPGGAGYPAYGPGQVLAWPYYGLGGLGTGGASASPAMTYDAVPLAEVAVRRGEHVHATDGLIGRVQGLVIDPRRHQVTHVLLQEGHVWGHKEVAIPIGAVAGADGVVRLRLSKQEAQDLPPVHVG
jgi:sporulation protein YlmC with PRC-barrel domain